MGKQNASLKAFYLCLQNTFFFNHLILALMQRDNNLVIIDLSSLSYDTDGETESKRGLLSRQWLESLQDKNPGFLTVNDWVLHSSSNRLPKKKWIFPYYCNGEDTKQDTMSIENQKISHITWWLSKLSVNIVPMMSFIYIICLVYWFGQTVGTASTWMYGLTMEKYFNQWLQMSLTWTAQIAFLPLAHIPKLKNIRQR